MSFTFENVRSLVSTRFVRIDLSVSHTQIAHVRRSCLSQCNHKTIHLSFRTARALKLDGTTQHHRTAKFAAVRTTLDSLLLRTQFIGLFVHNRRLFTFTPFRESSALLRLVRQDYMPMHQSHTVQSFRTHFFRRFSSTTSLFNKEKRS